MTEVWNTKYGARRVRHDPPTLAEAIVAAQGLSDDLQQQAEIAASLMELPLEEVKAELVKTRVPRRTTSTVAFSGHRAVVVERKLTRRPMSAGAVRRGL